MTTVGGRVYYTGDRANSSGWGTVTAATAINVTIALDDGRVLSTPLTGIGNAYHGHYDPRFVTKAAYDTFRATR